MANDKKPDRKREEQQQPRRGVSEADLARMRRMGQDPKWFDDIV